MKWKAKAKPAIIGFLSACLVLKMNQSLFPSPVPKLLVDLFMGYTACVYLGAALADARAKWISIEFMMSLLFFTTAVLGLLYSPIWIGIGYTLHGIWDMLHHPRLIQTKVVRWFPPLCAFFDWVTAAFIFFLY